MNLPTQPGLQRRLAYAEYVKRRNNTLQNSMRNYTPIYTPIYTQNYAPIYTPNYHNITIKKHKKLSIKDLLHNTRLRLTTVNFNCSICHNNETDDAETTVSTDDDQNDQVNHMTRLLQCKHQFHINCIDTWFINNTTCPICRFDLI
jgi:hypothetical protein